MEEARETGPLCHVFVWPSGGWSAPPCAASRVSLYILSIRFNHSGSGGPQSLIRLRCAQPPSPRGRHEGWTSGDSLPASADSARGEGLGVPLSAAPVLFGERISRTRRIFPRAGGVGEKGLFKVYYLWYSVCHRKRAPDVLTCDWEEA